MAAAAETWWRRKVAAALQRHRKSFAGMVVVCNEEGNRASLSIGETITEINILILI
jgi:hypothetical protein